MIDSFISIEDLKDKMLEVITMRKLKGIDSREKPVITIPAAAISDVFVPTEEDPTEGIPEGIPDDIPEKVPEEVPAEIPVGESSFLKIPEAKTDLDLTALVTKERFIEACPPPSEEEFKALEELILKDGVIIQPILVWNGIIVDGHNRYSIAKKHGISFTVKEMEFESEEDIIVWIKENAISQRNLTDFAKYELIKDIKEILAAKGKGTQGRKASSTSKNTPHNTRKKLADKAGISPSQIQRAELIDKKADEATKEKLRKGELKIGKVHNELTGKAPKEFSFKRAAKELEKWARKYSEEDQMSEFVPLVLDIVDKIKQSK
jgi:ParB-like chromosome segregation protein Spo0J